MGFREACRPARRVSRQPPASLFAGGPADLLAFGFVRAESPAAAAPLCVSRMKRRALTISCLLLAAAALAGAGCASIGARSGKYEPYVYPTIYPGPKTIIYGMQHQQGVAHNILVWPCGIIDFPLS